VWTDFWAVIPDALLALLIFLPLAATTLLATWAAGAEDVTPS
jgi:hypothetical protein